MTAGGTGAPDLDRVMEIRCRAADRSWTHGTGYLVAPGTVLTARHVVERAAQRPTDVEVRPASRTNRADWCGATNVVLAGSSRLDAALLELVPDPAQQTRTPTAGVLDVAAAIPFHACGFPYAAGESEPGALRRAETVEGVTRVGARDGRLQLDVTGPHPAARAPGADGRARTGWAGLSGAALFGPDNLLLGVVIAANPRFEGGRLQALPITDVLADPRLGPLLPTAWRDAELSRVSYRLTMAMGERDRFRLRSPGHPRGPVVLGRSGALSPTALLSSRAQVVPFLPRQQQLDRLRAWCDEELAVSYAVLAGPGGAGKSRIAAALCDTLAAEGWVTGVAELVPDRAGSSDVVAVPDIGRPLLVVLDYADHLQAVVARMLAGTVISGGRKIRILAVVRDGEAFSHRLGMELGRPADALSSGRVLSLTATGLSPEERRQHYDAAIEHFAKALGLESTSRPAAADGLEPGRPTDDSLAELGTPLLLHAKGLLDLLGASAPATAVPDHRAGSKTAGSRAGTAAEELLSALVEREDERFWKAGVEDLLPSPRARRIVFAVSTLVGADDEAAAVAALSGAEPLLDWQPYRLHDLVDRLRDMLGGRPLPLVEPDLLGEQLIAVTLTGPAAPVDALTEAVDSAAAPGQRSRALEVLLRMCSSPIGSVGPDSRRALSGLLTKRIKSLIEQAVTAPDELNLPSQLAAALDLTEHECAEIDAQSMVSLLPRSTLFQPLVAALNSAASRAAAADGQYERAVALTTSAVTALTAAGLLEAAESPLEKAYSYLSMANRIPSQAANQALARVLNAGSAVNLALSRAAVGLEHAEHAMALAEAAGEGSSSLLLESRYALATAYGAVGRYQEAKEILRLACADSGGADTAIRAQLWCLYAFTLMLENPTLAAEIVAEGAAALRADAGACHEVAQLLTVQAQLILLTESPDEARAVLREAEDVASQLGDPAQEQVSRLLVAIKTVGALAAEEAEDLDEAEALARQATDIMYTLYTRSRDVYGPQYALSEAQYARMLASTERLEEAHEAARHALDAAEYGFADRPALYLSAIVVAAVAAAQVYCVDGDWDAASGELERACARASRLDPAAVGQADMAQLSLLSCLTEVELTAERPDRALAAADRLLGIAGTLLDRNPASFNTVVMISCRLLRVDALECLDRDREAMDEARITLGEAESLAATEPTDSHRRVLAQARIAVAGSHRAQGETQEALDLLRTTLEELRLEHETAMDRSDRDALNDLIRRLETGEIDNPSTDDSVPPENFSDLLPGPHRVTLGRRHGTDVAARAFRPILVLGPQRSRKTTGLVVPTLLEWNGPAVVTSVRSDVAMATIAHRSRLGQTWVFEPTGELFSGGSAITTWNPVDGCEDFERAVAMAHALTEAGRSDSGNRQMEGFWYEQASLLIQPLLHAAACSRMTMRDVSRWIRTETRAEVQARLMYAPSREAADIFQSFGTMAEVTRSGVYATARSVLRVYESEAVRRASEAGGFSVPDLFSGCHTLYLCAPPEEQERLAPVFTALVRSVITEAYRRQGQALNLLLLLDEAGNIAPVENLDTIATTAAGTGIQLVSVFHDMAQLTATYDEHRARSIMTNHSALMVLPGNRDPLTMDLVGRILAEEDDIRMRRRSVRRLRPGTALCVYEHLPVQEVTLRSSSHDESLRALSPPEDADGLIVERR